MIEISSWIIISAVLFILFITLLIAGVMKRSRKILLIGTPLFFILFLMATAYTSYKVFHKAYNKISGTYKLRTGEEIYVAIFGKASPDCLKIRNYQDQTVPIIDDAILLEFTTCPEELKRILSQNQFTSKKESTRFWTRGSSNLHWWKPETLGDTVLLYDYSSPDYKRNQHLIVSLDSSRVFYKDVLF
jgi:hypothetical protein